MCPHPQQCMETQRAQEGREDSPHVPSLSPATLQVRAMLQTAQIFFLHRTHQSRDLSTPEMWGKELQVLLEQSSGGTWLRVWMEFSLDLAMAVPVVPISSRGRSWSSSGLAQCVPGAVKVLLRGGRHRLAPCCCRSSWSQSPGAP